MDYEKMGAINGEAKMESRNNSRAEGTDWSALRERIEASRVAGGTIIGSVELQALVAAARGNAEGQVVPAALLLRAIGQLANASSQPIVQLDIATADALVTMACGELVTPPADGQSATEPGLELIA